MRNTLLIIDDSELDRAIFNEIFKKDYRVLRAATAWEGIDQVRKHVLDIAVVVLDICLQRGPSGFAVLDRIHKLEGCSRIPVILLTAEPEPQWVYRGVEIGAADFLVKPLAPIATQERIRSIIEQHWGTEEEQDADAPEDFPGPGRAADPAVAAEIPQLLPESRHYLLQLRPAAAGDYQRLGQRLLRAVSRVRADPLRCQADQHGLRLCRGGAAGPAG